MELAASHSIAYNKMPYHLPTLLFPLLKHQVNVKKKELAPNLKFDNDGNCLVNNLLQEFLDAIIKDELGW